MKLVCGKEDKMKSMNKSKIKTSTSYKVFQIFNTVFLTLLAFLTAYPIYHVVMASISNGTALISHKGFLLHPVGKITFDAFTAVFKNPNIATGYRNTIFLLVVGVSLQILMTSIGAYVLSREQFGLRKVFMLFITFTMFFQGGMIPFFLLVRGLNLQNNLFALILPFMVNAYNLIIMRTSFAAIPASLEESAKIDGANHWTVYTKIVLPLSKAVIAVIVLYYGVGIWNGWFWGSIFMRKRELYPLQLVLREILISNDVGSMAQGADDIVGIGETIKYATIVVSTVPILMVYPFLQKYFAKGVMIGAVKG